MRRLEIDHVEDQMRLLLHIIETEHAEDFVSRLKTMDADAVDDILRPEYASRRINVGERVRIPEGVFPAGAVGTVTNTRPKKGYLASRVLLDSGVEQDFFTSRLERLSDVEKLAEVKVLP